MILEDANIALVGGHGALWRMSLEQRLGSGRLFYELRKSRQLKSGMRPSFLLYSGALLYTHSTLLRFADSALFPNVIEGESHKGRMRRLHTHCGRDCKWCQPAHRHQPPEEYMQRMSCVMREMLIELMT